jgi:hypothetical protein
VSDLARSWKALAKHYRAKYLRVLGVMSMRVSVTTQLKAQLRGMDEVAEHRAEELRKLREGVRDAKRSLEATRWNPEGPLTSWVESPDGRNHARVMDALDRLRALLGEGS